MYIYTRCGPPHGVKDGWTGPPRLDADQSNPRVWGVGCGVLGVGCVGWGRDLRDSTRMPDHRTLQVNVGLMYIYIYTSTY